MAEPMTYTHTKNGTDSREPRSRWKRRLLTFKRGTRGVAAVEFAMLLPFMATVTFGTAELLLRFQTSDQFQRYTFQVGDLIAQFRNDTPATKGTNFELTDAQLKDLLSYAWNSMQGKFTKGELRLEVASVGFEAKKGLPRVLWQRSFSSKGTKLTPGAINTSEMEGMGEKLETILRVKMSMNVSTPYTFIDPDETYDMEKIVYFRPRTERVMEINGVAAEQNTNWEKA
ncbi:MAG: TadE/TadG family type IV pilus assembly protein [Pseudomonadota bacterium]